MTPLLSMNEYYLMGKSQAINASIQGANAQINRGNLAAGIYILKVRTKAGLGTKKIIFKLILFPMG